MRVARERPSERLSNARNTRPPSMGNAGNRLNAARIALPQNNARTKPSGLGSAIETRSFASSGMR